MDAATLPKGQSPERTDGRNVNMPGIYVHKDTGTEFITSPGEEGIVQADALMSEKWKGTPWEWQGDVPTRVELQERQRQQLIKDTAADKVAGNTDKETLEAEVAKEVAKLKGTKKPETVEATPAPGTGANY